MSEIPQVKALEYQQVAALACEDIELLYLLSQKSYMTLERLKLHVERVRKMKEKMIHDPQSRQVRFDAMCDLWNLVRKD